MQPSPIAETVRPCVPSLRCSIALFYRVSGVPFEDAAQEAIVIRKGSGHRIGLLLPRTGATLDVSKKKGCRSFRERPFEHVASAPRVLRCA